MTPRSLITLALKQVGAVGLGQPARPEYLADAFTVLNMMLAQWAQRRWLVYRLDDVSFPATGAYSYSIGPGGDVDTPRPDRLEAAFVRMNPGPRTGDGFILDQSMLDVGVLDPLNPGQSVPVLSSIDYPLDVLPAREDYNLIGLKAQPGFPAAIFYDSNYPLGTLYVWPVPGPQFEIHVTVKQALTGFATLDDTEALPDEYQEALLHNLTGHLAPLFQVPVPPEVVALARASLNTIRNSNTQVPRLRMPSGLPGMGRNRFGWAGGYGGIAAAAPAAAVVPPPPAAAVPNVGFVLNQSRLNVDAFGPAGVPIGERPLSQITLT